jgi:two-component system, cell cycle response regulator
LPRAASSDLREAAAGAVMTLEKKVNLPAKTILIVDDDNFFREVLKDTLVARYRVIESGTSEDVLRLAISRQPDMIILDIEMPGTCGIQLCQQLKEQEQTRHIPVLLLSGRSKKEEIILGLQAGADDYLTKPMCPPEILARIDAHLRSKGFYAELEHRDLMLLLELSESLTVSRNPMKILQLIVEKVCEVIEVARCSIVSVGRSGDLVVKASSDLEKNVELRLDMARYPEIRQALKTRRAVVVSDIKNDPLMETVRQYVADLDFNSIIVIPIIKKESVIGTFFLRTASRFKGEVSERIFNLCHLVANISAHALENAILFESMKNAREFLEEMAIRDGLTCLYTHRHFYDRLDVEFSRAVRHHEPLSLIFFDIDDFKRINDNYGHLLGDEVLREIGRCIKHVVRDSDVPARYGGEEFAVLLPNTESGGAREMARRLGATIREQRHESLSDETITVSMGIATFTNGNMTSYSQLVQDADSAMYKAKSRGKDQLAVAAETPAEE